MNLNSMKVQMNLQGIDFERYADGSDLTFVFRENLYYDYLIQDSTLTLFTANGSINFTKIGG